MTFKEIRNKAGVEQEAIGKALKIKQSAVSMWETGKARPKTKHLPKIAEILGVSVDELIACFSKSNI